MFIPAQKDLTALRNAPFEARIAIVGVDFTGVSTARFALFYNPDDAAALLTLDGASTPAPGEGMSFSVETTNGVPTTTFSIRVNKSTIAAQFPWPANGLEPGQVMALNYNFELTKAGVNGGMETRWQQGQVLYQPKSGHFSSTSCAAANATVLQLGNDNATVFQAQGADLIGPIVVATAAIRDEAIAARDAAKTAARSFTRNQLAIGRDYGALSTATAPTGFVAVTDATLLAKGFAVGWTDTTTANTRQAIALTQLPNEVRSAPCWIAGRVFVQVDQDNFAPTMEGYLWDPASVSVGAGFAFTPDPANSTVRAIAYTFTCRYTGATPIDRLLIGASWPAARSVVVTGLQFAASTATPIVGLDVADYPGDYDTGDMTAHTRRLARRSAMAGPRAFDDKPMGQALGYIRAGIGLVQSGQRDATIALLGDSILRHPVDVGFGSSLDSAMVGIFASIGIAATNDSFFGLGGFSIGALQAFDTRHQFGPGWNELGFPSIGGTALGNESTTSSWLFTARQPYNIARLYYTTFFNFAQFRVRIDGGPWTTVTQGPLPENRISIDIDAPLGMHVLEIQPIGNGTVGAIHIDCIRSDRRQVRVMNWAQTGQSAVGMAASHNDFGARRGQMGQLLYPDLTLINLGTNDVLQGLDPEQSLTAMRQIIGIPKVSLKDVALIQPTPADPSALSAANHAARRRLIERAARATNTPIIADFAQQWGPWALANGAGNVVDAIGHPSGGGRWNMARQLINTMLYTA